MEESEKQKKLRRLDELDSEKQRLLVEQNIKKIQNRIKNSEEDLEQKESFPPKVAITIFVLLAILIGSAIFYTVYKIEQNKKDMIKLKIENERIRQGLKNTQPHNKTDYTPKQEL